MGQHQAAAREGPEAGQASGLSPGRQSRARPVSQVAVSRLLIVPAAVNGITDCTHAGDLLVQVFLLINPYTYWN